MTAAYNTSSMGTQSCKKQAGWVCSIPGKVSQVAPVTFDHDRQHAHFPVQPLHASTFQLVAKVHEQASTVSGALCIMTLQS